MAIDTVALITVMLFALAAHEVGHWQMATSLGLQVPSVEIGRKARHRFNPSWIIRLRETLLTIRPVTLLITGNTEVPGAEQLPPMKLLAIAAAGPLTEALILMLPWAVGARPNLVVAVFWCVWLGKALTNFIPTAVEYKGEIHLTDGGLLWLAIKRMRNPSFSEADLAEFKRYVKSRGKVGSWPLLLGICLVTYAILAGVIWLNWDAYQQPVNDLADMLQRWIGR